MLSLKYIKPSAFGFFRLHEIAYSAYSRSNLVTMKSENIIQNVIQSLYKHNDKQSEISVVQLEKIGSGFY